MDRRDFIEKSALATGGKPAPGRADEPWKGMNFIR